MNMKELRNIHRKKFTYVTEEPGAKEDEYVKTRHRNKDYVPFKVWLRALDKDDFTGKALKIREGGQNAE